MAGVEPRHYAADVKIYFERSGGGSCYPHFGEENS